MPKERDSKSNQGDAQSRLSRLKQPQVWIPASVFAVAVLFLILFRVKGQAFQWKVDARDWTGFGQSYDNDVSEVTEKGTETTGTTTKQIDKTTTTTKKLQPAKTLWDWTQLFLAPATLAVLGFRFQYLQEKAKREKEEADKARVADQQREQALQTYFDQLSALLVDKQLKTLLPASQASVSTKTARSEQLIDAEAALDVVKARTLSLLRMFDEDIPRKASVLSFLADADLLKRLDLDLSGVKLDGANLKTVNFFACQLSGAILDRTDLSHADLSNANLERALLSNADLSHADLSNANLERALLSNANLLKTNLSSANLSIANLELANLELANLSDTEIIGANLSNSNLGFANLDGASLFKANLDGARLFKADLRGTDLSGAKFWDSDLTPADLNRAKKDAVERIQSAKNWQEANYDPEISALLFPPKSSETTVKD